MVRMSDTCLVAPLRRIIEREPIMACEDFPCCGHGPAPMGDGGGCPDSEGRFDCTECGGRLARNAPSSICSRCRNRMMSHHDDCGYDDNERTDYF